MATTPEPPREPDIKLPGEWPTHLFVLQQASNLAIHRLHTKDAYNNEVLTADVKSMSNMMKDTDESFSRRLQAKKDLYGAIKNIPDTRMHLRPPNILVIFVALFAVGAVVVYGQTNPVISSQFWYVIDNYGVDVAFFAILVIGMLLYLAVRRRRPKK